MLLYFRLRAGLTDSLDLDAELLYPKPRRQPATQLNGIDASKVKVRDRPASRTNQMMMRLRIAIDSPAVMRGYFMQHASFDECPEVLVHRRKRYRRQFFLHSVVDFLRRV